MKRKTSDTLQRSLSGMNRADLESHTQAVLLVLYQDALQGYRKNVTEKDKRDARKEILNFGKALKLISLKEKSKTADYKKKHLPVQ